MHLIAQRALAIAEKFDDDLRDKPGRADDLFKEAQRQITQQIKDTDKAEGGQFNRPLRDICGLALSYVLRRSSARADDFAMGGALKNLRVAAERTQSEEERAQSEEARDGE